MSLRTCEGEIPPAETLRLRFGLDLVRVAASENGADQTGQQPEELQEVDEVTVLGHEVPPFG
jgi:hypothetical protein